MQNWQSVNHIPGIHDNGPRDQALWCLTLTAYEKWAKDYQLELSNSKFMSFLKRRFSHQNEVIQQKFWQFLAFPDKNEK